MKPYSKKKKPIKNFDPDYPRRKKMYGQHFLRKQSVVDHMIDKVEITPETTVMEIGCGDGFLTRSILEQTDCKKLICFEIDEDWATYVKKKIQDPRLDLRLENILDTDLAQLESEGKLVLLANLPYQITFPIIFKLKEQKQLFSEGVIMIQEEVAQKILASHGKGYSSTTLFLQHHFTWSKMEKVEPGAFSPPPKIFSRLLHFKPRFDAPEIPNEAEFWKFLKLCFRSPRQTIKNNLRTTHYALDKFPEEIQKLRAQQLTFEEFLNIWNTLGIV